MNTAELIAEADLILADCRAFPASREVTDELCRITDSLKFRLIESEAEAAVMRTQLDQLYRWWDMRDGHLETQYSASVSAKIKEMRDALTSTTAGSGLLAEVERLREWKESAIAQLAAWDRVWEAAGLPGRLGGSKAEAVQIEIERLRQG